MDKIKEMTNQAENDVNQCEYIQYAQDVEKTLRSGDLSPIRAYLREHIHQYGTMRETKKLLKDATGEEFNPDYYIQYLKAKYSKLYRL